MSFEAEIAHRIDQAVKRVERLETLEYETVAFAAGGGATLLCDIVLAVPSASVTLCPVALPITLSHLWLVISCVSDREVPIKLRMQVNGDMTSSYSYYVREELPTAPFPPGVGAGDTEATQVGGPGTFGTFWEICHPSSTISPFFGGGTKPRNACLVTFTDYNEPTLRQYMTWFAYSQREATGFVDFRDVDQGGGRYIGGGAITSIRVFHPSPGVMLAGSQFTLYGL